MNIMTWYRIKGPTDADTWALGFNIGGQIEHPAAVVTRRDDGKWDWHANGSSQTGTEPSRNLAMTTAESILGNGDYPPNRRAIRKGVRGWLKWGSPENRAALAKIIRERRAAGLKTPIPDSRHPMPTDDFMTT